MRVDRHSRTERLQHVDLARRVVEMIVTTNHVRDAHIHVVHDDAEVIGRIPVRARDDQIIQLGILERHQSVDEIIHDHLALQGILEADHRLDAGSRFVADPGTVRRIAASAWPEAAARAWRRAPLCVQ